MIITSPCIWNHPSHSLDSNVRQRGEKAHLPSWWEWRSCRHRKEYWRLLDYLCWCTLAGREDWTTAAAVPFRKDEEEQKLAKGGVHMYPKYLTHLLTCCRETKAIRKSFVRKGLGVVLSRRYLLGLIWGRWVHVPDWRYPACLLAYLPSNVWINVSHDDDAIVSYITEG